MENEMKIQHEKFSQSIERMS